MTNGPAATLETWFPAVALAMALVSYFMHRWLRAAHPMTLAETASNVVIFAVWRFVFFAGGIALQLVIFGWLASLIPWKLPPGPLTIALAVLVADFLYYWRHRYEHEWSVLWAQHQVHHSSEEFNLSTSLRLPWVASYINWPFLAPALLFGFSAEQLILGYQLVLAYQYLVHTEFVGRLGPLERMLNTPSNHRVHHGRDVEYLDRNYAGILIVWDRWFGTYAPERRAPDFGTTTPIGTTNPIAINLRPWVELARKLAREPSMRRRARMLFMKPGET